jgi:hypothetical protein
MDVTALFSQEYESVEALVQHDHKFDKHVLTRGEDLTYGSVGLEAVDMDRDGDKDLLYVHGDCFDNNFANRSHGIGWLENRGQMDFHYHHLMDLPGAYRALAVDMDADDDIDILAVANLPTGVYPQSLGESQPVSIVLLEQTGRLAFSPRVLERGTPRYPALEVGDFDGDGRNDFAVGAQLFDTDPPGSAAAQLPRVAIWWQK